MSHSQQRRTNKHQHRAWEVRIKWGHPPVSCLEEGFGNITVHGKYSVVPHLLIHSLLNVNTFIIEELVFRIITVGVGGDDL